MVDCRGHQRARGTIVRRAAAAGSPAREALVDRHEPRVRPGRYISLLRYRQRLTLQLTDQLHERARVVAGAGRPEPQPHLAAAVYGAHAYRERTSWYPARHSIDRDAFSRPTRTRYHPCAAQPPGDRV